MKRLMITFLAAVLGTGSASFAVDVFPWQGAEGSTYQEWSFSTSATTPTPDKASNQYGDPLLKVTATGDWIEDPGMWPLSGQIDVVIPNRPEPLERKEIWVRLRWAPQQDTDPFLPEAPMVDVWPYTRMEKRYVEESVVPGTPWVNSRFEITIWPNPDKEWFVIKGDILVDHLIIETACVPEPTTVVLLGLGGLSVLHRKRKSFLKSAGA